MIFTQNEISQSLNNYNAESILESAHYVDIPIISPNTIAVCEASITDDVSVGVIRYSDIESLCEEYGLDYDEALSSIANTNNIDINALCIAVDESEVILDPSIVEDIPNVVINPISEDSLAYQYCEILLEAYIDSGDEDYLEAIINENIITGFISRKTYDKRKKWREKYIEKFGSDEEYENLQKEREKKKYEDLDKKQKDLDYKHKELEYRKKQIEVERLEKEVMKAAEGKPASWISKKIASLRSMYSNWLQKANTAVNQNQANIFKKIATKIMNVIDKLMAKLQDMTY